MADAVHEPTVAEVPLEDKDTSTMTAAQKKRLRKKRAKARADVGVAPPCDGM